MTDNESRYGKDLLIESSLERVVEMLIFRMKGCTKNKRGYPEEISTWSFSQMRAAKKWFNHMVIVEKLAMENPSSGAHRAMDISHVRGYSLLFRWKGKFPRARECGPHYKKTTEASIPLLTKHLLHRIDVLIERMDAALETDVDLQIIRILSAVREEIFEFHIDSGYYFQSITKEQTRRNHEVSKSNGQEAEQQHSGLTRFPERWTSQNRKSPTELSLGQSSQTSRDRTTLDYRGTPQFSHRKFLQRTASVPRKFIAEDGGKIVVGMVEDREDVTEWSAFTVLSPEGSVHQMYVQPSLVPRLRAYPCMWRHGDRIPSLRSIWTLEGYSIGIDLFLYNLLTDTGEVTSAYVGWVVRRKMRCITTITMTPSGAFDQKPLWTLDGYSALGRLAVLDILTPSGRLAPTCLQTQLFGHLTLLEVSQMWYLEGYSGMPDEEFHDN